MITVRELIAHLSQFPPDAPCISMCGSEYCSTGDLMPVLNDKESQKIVFRNGMYLAFNPCHWPVDEDTVFVTVVAFPGN